MKIRVNSIRYNGSTVDGPGIRTVVFLQGCNMHCKGCHNPSTWDPLGGIEYDTEELIEELRHNSINKKITISGGEPLIQIEAVNDLLTRLDNFDVCLYTGMEYEDVPYPILSKLRCIKCGSYHEELKCSNIPFIGSSNQSFVFLNGGAARVE
mgnify:CR=1 FL=1